MYILAIDTATKHFVSSISQEDKFLAGSFSKARKTHSDEILIDIQENLEDAKLSLDDIDYFAASEGPGSFTGLRIGIATIQALALAKEKPCLKVNTLEAIAYGKRDASKITIPMLDARNRRVYAAAYLGDKTILEAQVSTIDEFIDKILEEIDKQDIEVKEILFAGDDARLQYAQDEKILSKLNAYNISTSEAFYEPEALGKLAYQQVEAGNLLKPEELLPEYYEATEAYRNLSAEAKRKIDNSIE